ncbi:hypothetical protein F5Y18DRAFT_81799 [Xylariaceae sp. FL1019]|nr:hypothetical protein F5Y18DRAFT_81799 [Xylariaceae sp. FL1019]
MGVSTAYFLSVFLETFLLCTPVQYNWDKTIPNGVCHNPNNIAYLLAGITNLIIDAIIVALPMPKLYKLQIPLARRLAIGAMFALGAVICVISLLRILAILSWNLDDSTYTGTGIAIYSILEPTFGVVNTCLPTIRPALRKLFDHDAFTVARKDSQFSKGSSSGYAHQHRFSQLTDDVPLTQIHAVGAPRETPEGDNNITIMREWKVSLTKQDDADITRDQQKNY